MVRRFLSASGLPWALAAARHFDRAAEVVSRSADGSEAQSRMQERIARRRSLAEVLGVVRSQFESVHLNVQMRRWLGRLDDAWRGPEDDDSGELVLPPVADEWEREAAGIAAHLVETTVEQDRSATEPLRSERRHRTLVGATSAAVRRYFPGRPLAETSPWWLELAGQRPEEMQHDPAG